ncbi:MAG: hypothetical protein ACI9A7_002246 [Cyclobacteriaceae bacterium]|jgi:hypothetical protein
MMNAKLIVTLNASFLGILGVLLTFLPEEISQILELEAPTSLIFSLLGAAYFAMAMTNWTARGSILGGIYGRAIVIGNFTHFSIAGLMLIKIQLANTDSLYLWPISIGFVLSALVFGYLFFTSPVKS